MVNINQSNVSIFQSLASPNHLSNHWPCAFCPNTLSTRPPRWLWRKRQWPFDINYDILKSFIESSKTPVWLDNRVNVANINYMWRMSCLWNVL